MPLRDGPSSSLFQPLVLRPWREGGAHPGPKVDLQGPVAEALDKAPSGDCVAWGLPFKIRSRFQASSSSLNLKIQALRAPWLIFRHTADLPVLSEGRGGLLSPMKGEGLLGEVAADYAVVYADGTEEKLPIRRRFQVGTYQRRWGENCFEAVPDMKPRALAPHHEQGAAPGAWGSSQQRAWVRSQRPWTEWLWAWKNPRPGKAIVGFRLSRGESGRVFLSAITAGWVKEHPLRWEGRRKVLLKLKPGEKFDSRLDGLGCLEPIQVDMGQIISAQPRPLYPEGEWERSGNNELPLRSENEILVEYTAHPDAVFHLGKRKILASRLGRATGTLRVVPPALHRVRLRVLDGRTGKPVPVKLHVHGVSGEYLPPVHRHRIPNPSWFEDFSADFVHSPAPLWIPPEAGRAQAPHFCSYIDGDVDMDLPLGNIFVEVSKGFEVRPIRKLLKIRPETKDLKLVLDKVLPWREKGWVTADTHVHFLSPQTGVLEGSAEGVNVINLLASQWGELMTNVGDFDGKTTWGSKEAGGDGEWLVRVGTENRQQVLGHISLIGYEGRMIAPMTVGGPDESALGDPVGILLTEWAAACRKQKGLVVLPHFPNPRAEHAATLVSGLVDGIEMTSWGHLYDGISPYSLSDWYRYLNCGYLVAAVGGTDKMSADTPVGAVRTYARLRKGETFTFEAWKSAVRRAETFVTYGPLMEFRAEGRPMGSRLKLGPGGGTLDLEWRAASVALPMTRVELVVNGEIRESLAIPPDRARGVFRLKVLRSSWAALLIRGRYPGKPEVVAAHSSPIMAEVRGSAFFAAADAVTILEQIEGALAFLDTVGTRAEEKRRKEMKLVLTSAHRALHNRLHDQGHGHRHGGASRLDHHH